MKLNLAKCAFMGAALALMGTAASAATIDFTRNASVGAISSGSVKGVGYTVTANGALNNSQRYDGGTPFPMNSFGLAFDRDGLGVGDDEISRTISNSEFVRITFDRAVEVTGFAFLDLFRARQGQSREAGVVRVGGNGGSPDAVLLAVQDFAERGVPGYAELTGLSLFSNEFTFRVRNGNDAVGVADGALAAVQVGAVPIPAAGVLLVGALGGLAAMRRRARKAA